MGAALTCARPYPLFTLVGIAGGMILMCLDLCDGPFSPSRVDGPFEPKDGRMPAWRTRNGHTSGITTKGGHSSQRRCVGEKLTVVPQNQGKSPAGVRSNSRFQLVLSE